VIGRRPAVFLDRDGVLNEYLPGDYVKRPEEMKVLPGAPDAVRALNRAGLPVFVISNQQGVAKGLMSGDDLARVDALLHEAVAAGGGRIERSYYCPHAADAACACRKPQAGLLLRAADEHGLDLAASFFVGDTDTDAAAARAAGVGRFVLVLTGKHRGAEVAADRALFPVAPDFVAADLGAAAAWITGASPAARR
jgi:D-glycero-D-manno-heptose 1,7-bisphosphate phosphatase